MADLNINADYNITDLYRSEIQQIIEQAKPDSMYVFKVDSYYLFLGQHQTIEIIKAIKKEGNNG